MKYFLILFLFLSPPKAHAVFTHDDLLHLTAHVGASYALQTVFYGFNSRVLKMNKLDSQILAAVVTLGIGFLYKVDENADGIATRRAFGENALGVGLAIGTHVVFEF